MKKKYFGDQALTCLGRSHRKLSWIKLSVGLVALLTCGSIQAQNHPNCSSSSFDPDGDGYGWENNKTCIVVSIDDNDAKTGGSCPTNSLRYCSNGSNGDPDGDGWGWDGDSCIVPNGNQDNCSGGGAPSDNTAGTPTNEQDSCDYTDASKYGGWGWNPVTEESCPPLPTVVDTPGDTVGSTGGNNEAGSCVTRNITSDSNPLTSRNENATRWDFSTGSCGEDPANTVISADGQATKITVTNTNNTLPDSSRVVNSNGNVTDNRGLRTYCHMSHFSYDDPVVKPTGSAHLHMFWGNTGTNQSTDTLDTNVSSTCDGGIRNRSAYWMPAMFDGDLNVVIPKQVLTYYKTVGASVGNRELPFPDGFKINDIPDDLQMLADRNVVGYSRSGGFKVGDCQVPDLNLQDTNVGRFNNQTEAYRTCVRRKMDSGGDLSFKIAMPNCLAIKDNGEPILSDDAGRPFNRHLAYSQNAPNQNGFRTDNYCPISHPYRIPQVELVAMYDIQGLGNWQLSSDHMMPDLPRGATLHADYIAKWERGEQTPESAMSFMVRCNMDKANCEHGEDSNNLLDRFNTVMGTYDAGAKIIDGPIRPFANFQPARMRMR